MNNANSKTMVVITGSAKMGFQHYILLAFHDR